MKVENSYIIRNNIDETLMRVYVADMTIKTILLSCVNNYKHDLHFKRVELKSFNKNWEVFEDLN